MLWLIGLLGVGCLAALAVVALVARPRLTRGGWHNLVPRWDQVLVGLGVIAGILVGFMIGRL